MLEKGRRNRKNEQGIKEGIGKGINLKEKKDRNTLAHSIEITFGHEQKRQ